MHWDNVAGSKVASYLGVIADACIPLQELVPIEFFIELLWRDKKFRNLDAHWREQIKQIPIDIVQTIFLVRIEEVSHFLRRMLSRLYSAGGDDFLFDTRCLGNRYMTYATCSAQSLKEDPVLSQQVWEAYSDEYKVFFSRSGLSENWLPADVGSHGS